MSDWIAQLKGVLESGQPAALVTVVAVEGSTPRDEGTKMVVTQDGIPGYGCFRYPPTPVYIPGHDEVYPMMPRIDDPEKEWCGEYNHSWVNGT